MSKGKYAPEQGKLTQQLAELQDAKSRDEETILAVKTKLLRLFQLENQTFSKQPFLKLYNQVAKDRQLDLHQEGYISDLNSFKTSSRMRDTTTTQNLVETMIRWLSHPGDYFLPVRDGKRFVPDADSEADRELQHRLLKAVNIDVFDRIPEKELQMMFSLLTTHQRSHYQQQFGNTKLAKIRYHNDSYQYVEELIDAFATLEPLKLGSGEVSRKFLKYSQAEMSDKILAYYNTYDTVDSETSPKKLETLQGVRRELYTTALGSKNSLGDKIVSMTERSRQLVRIAERYDAFYQKNKNNTDMDFWIQASQEIINELEAGKRFVPDIVNAENRFLKAENKNYINALGMFHGICNDIEKNITRDGKIISALNKYL